MDRILFYEKRVILGFLRALISDGIFLKCSTKETKSFGTKNLLKDSRNKTSVFIIGHYSTEIH